MSEQDDKEGKKIITAKVLVQNGDGKFLAIRNSEDREKTAGKWELPGGRLKYGEDRFKASRREMKEEFALEVENLQDVVRIEVESDHLVSCYILFSDEWNGEPELREDKHSEYRWVTADEFMELDWHSDAGYDIVPMKCLKEYLEKEKIY
jgi:8-oxo-dGTP diphosphatase